MDYIICYKTLYEISALLNPMENFIADYDIDADEIKRIISVNFDLVIVTDDMTIKNILCSDEKTLILLKHIMKIPENTDLLTKSYRCIIIKYQNIIRQMDYDEFCDRYNHTTGVK